MWRIVGDITLIAVLVVVLLAGLASSGYAMYWIYQKIGLWIILLAPFIVTSGPFVAMLVTAPLSLPLMMALKKNPKSLFYDD